MIKQVFNDTLRKINTERIIQIIPFLILFGILIEPKVYNIGLFSIIIVLIIERRKNKFEVYKVDVFSLLLIASFLLSSIGENQFSKREFFQFIKILLLLILSLRINVKNFKNKMKYFFLISTIYGVLRLLISPMVLTGDTIRRYAYLKYIMDSSIVSLVNYIYGTLLFLKGENIKDKILGVIISISSIGMIILSSVRASFLSFFIISLFIFFTEFKKQYKKIIVFLILFSIFLLFFKNIYINEYNKLFYRLKSIVEVEKKPANESNVVRLEVWRKTISEFNENKLKTYGYGNYRRISIKFIERDIILTHPHNEYITLLMEVGIFNLILWVLFKIYLFNFLYKIKDRMMSLFGMLILINLEIHNLFDLYIHRRGVYVYIFLLIGILLSESKER